MFTPRVIGQIKQLQQVLHNQLAAVTTRGVHTSSQAARAHLKLPPPLASRLSAIAFELYFIFMFLSKAVKDVEGTSAALREALENNRLSPEIEVSTFVCPEKRLLVCAPAKSSSSSAKAWVMKHCGIHDPTLVYRLSDETRKVTFNHPENRGLVREALTNYTRIVVVRDPWTRVVSGYVDKFFDKSKHRARPGALSPHVAAFAPTLNLSVATLEQGGVSWETFLSLITHKEDELHFWNHFSSQSWLCPSWMNFHYVARTEHLNADLRFLEQAIPQLDVITEYSAAKTSSLGIRQTVFHNCCKQVNDIGMRYKDDIEAFGYAFPPCSDDNECYKTLDNAVL